MKRLEATRERIERFLHRLGQVFRNLAQSYDTARTTEQTVQQEQGDNP